MHSASARQRRATIPLSNKSFDAIGLGNVTGSRSSTRGCGTVSGEAAAACLLLLPTPPTRRGSFLYRSSDSDSELSPMSLSRKLSATSETQKSIEETLVTPFAQILQSLRTVRDNYLAITNIPPELRQTRTADTQAENAVAIATDSATDQQTTVPAVINGTSVCETVTVTCTADVDANEEKGVTCQLTATTIPVDAADLRHRLAVDTLDELEWCLDQLESMQTHRSVANMAADKFKRLLNRELNQFSESSRSGNEISEYICNTFLDVPSTELQLPLLNVEDADEEMASASGRQSRRPSKQAATDSALIAGGGTTPTESVAPIVEDLSQTIAAAVDALEPEISDPQLVECMEVMRTWGPDIFHLAEVTNNRPLTPVVYTIMKEIDALRQLKITPLTMITYLTLLEHHYKPDNTYHNSIHAADVTQSANVLLGHSALQNVFTDIELLATLFATAVHDVDHPGVTSQYLINSGMELALMYNDQSVLENHHAAVAFKLLQEENADIFQNLSVKSYRALRRIVIDIVLATDMTKHMTLLADLKTLVETKRIAGSSVLKLEQYADRIQLLKTLVHCADLSNPTKPLYLYRQWADRVMEEFFRQGDLEREQGLEVSPMCDRYEPTVEQTQVSFIDYVVHPLWEAWSELVYPDCQDILDLLESNRDWYAARLARRTQAADTVVEERPEDVVDQN